jgi:hypothetical protein
MPDPILSIIDQIIHLDGGLTEQRGKDVVEAVLDEKSAKVLGVPSSVAFSSTLGLDDAYFVTFDSPILKQFGNLLGRRGALSAVHIRYEGYIKKDHFENPINAKIQVINATLRIGPAQTIETPYLDATMTYSAESEERRLGKTTFTLNAFTGAGPVDIGNALLFEADRTDVRSPTITMLPFETLKMLLEQISRRRIAEELAEWEHRIALRKNRDLTRLDAYYDSIVSEIQRRAARRREGNEAQQKDEGRIEATRIEQARKVRETHERYRLTVDTALYASLLLLMPVVHVHCTLQRRRINRPLSILWSPFTKQIEALRCEACNLATFQITLQEDGRILCRNCDSLN